MVCGVCAESGRDDLVIYLLVAILCVGLCLVCIGLGICFRRRRDPEDKPSNMV